MTRSSFDVTVVIATRNRASYLERTLISLQSQRLQGLALEIVVVDNGSTDNTKSVQNRVWPGLEIVALYEEAAGKSRALNQALGIVRSDLVVFTDDDITAAPTWLADIHRASQRYRNAAIFCGPIVPCFPPETPVWLREHLDSSGFFGSFQPQTHEGPIADDVLPFGANFAVKSFALQGMRFNNWFGPSAQSASRLGEDTEFVMRIRDRYQECIYVAAALVFHHIRSSQIDPEWIFERAFQLGLAMINLHRRPMLVHEKYRFEVGSTDRDQQRRLERGGLLNYYCGQLSGWGSLVGGGYEEADLRSALKLLEINSHRDLLGRSARLFDAAPDAARRIPWPRRSQG